MKYPITIVTGCLGSGKTTFLSEILKEKTMQNTAVLVNEFGKVGLDHHLLKQVEEKTLLLGGGCVCCSKRDDLENALVDLLNSSQKDKNEPFERVIIETTGLADPTPMMFTVLSHPLLQNHFYIDCVLTTVDCVNGLLHLDHQAESVKQVVASDKVLLTKTDIADDKQVETIKTKIKDVHPSVKIIEQKNDQVTSEILKTKEKDFSPRNELVHMDGENDADSTTQSLSISFDRPLDWTAFGLWLSMLLHARGEEVLRVKGLLDVNEKGPVVLNGVQHIIHPPQHLEKWPDGENLSHLIFIMRNIDPDEILQSLKTFQDFLGSNVQPLELVEQI